MKSRLFMLAAALVAGIFVPNPAAASPSPLPVPFELPAIAELELSNPGGSAPGSNDPACRPSPEKPNPVVLVHNTSGNKQTTWQMFAPLLANEGYCVYALTYGAMPGPWPVNTLGGLQSIDRSAAQLDVFVDEVLAETGAQKVVVLGHSQGTLVAAHWMRFLGGAAKVERSVALAPLWKGAHVLDDPALPDSVRNTVCPACVQMSPGSQYLTELATAGPFVDSVPSTNIVTTHDTVVEPYTNGMADKPNVTDIVLQDICPSAETTHLRMVADPLTASLVLSILDPARRTPTGCVTADEVVTHDRE